MEGGNNADQFKIIVSGEFNGISTSRGNIDRFKSEQAEKKTPATTPAPPSRRNAPPSAKSISRPPETSSKSSRAIVAGIILAILIVAGFLLTK